MIWSALVRVRHTMVIHPLLARLIHFWLVSSTSSFWGRGTWHRPVTLLRRASLILLRHWHGSRAVNIANPLVTKGRSDENHCNCSAASLPCWWGRTACVEYYVWTNPDGLWSGALIISADIGFAAPTKAVEWATELLWPHRHHELQSFCTCTTQHLNLQH